VSARTITPPTRRSILFGQAKAPPRVVVADHCLARQFVHCQSCGDVCSAQAIGFRPRIGGPPLPTIYAARCTGCGDCLAVCPVDALALTQDAADV
jgi:ferredoxin-type protein NapF